MLYEELERAQSPRAPCEISLDANSAQCEIIFMTLSDWLEMTGTRVTDFAKAVGCSVSVAHDWKTGRRTPRAVALAAIQRVTHGRVTAVDFLHPEQG